MVGDEFNLPETLPGSEWADDDVDQAKYWFATSCLEAAVKSAFVVLYSRGFTSIEHAEDAVSEWLNGRGDREGALRPARFEKALRNFDPSKGSLRAFLFSDLRRYVSGTYLRSLQRELSHETLDDLPIADAKANGLSVALLRDAISLVMEQLEPKEREILMLTGRGYRIAEIAEMLATSNGAVKTAISRARRRAREILGSLL